MAEETNYLTCAQVRTIFLGIYRIVGERNTSSYLENITSSLKQLKSISTHEAIYLGDSKEINTYPVRSYDYHKVFCGVCFNSVLYHVKEIYTHIRSWFYLYGNSFTLDPKKCWLSNIPDAFVMACTQDDIKMAQWLLTIYPPINNNSECIKIAFYNACDYGHVRMIQWLIRTFPQYDFWNNCSSIAAGLAFNGSYDILVRLSHIFPNLESLRYNFAFIVALKNNNLCVVRYLWNMLSDYYITPTYQRIYFTIAHNNGNLQILRWLGSVINVRLLFNKQEINAFIYKARKMGYTHVMEWLKYTYIRTEHE